MGKFKAQVLKFELRGEAAYVRECSAEDVAPMFDGDLSTIERINLLAFACAVERGEDGELYPVWDELRDLNYEPLSVVKGYAEAAIELLKLDQGELAGN